MFYEKFKKWEDDDMPDRNKDKDDDSDSEASEDEGSGKKGNLNEEENEEWQGKEWNELQDWDKEEHVGDQLQREEILKGLEGLFAYLNIPKHRLS